MKPYEWMVTYTPQTEWIEGRGILLWLAFYTGGLGGGLYLASLYFNSLPGMMISWLVIAVLKGGFHLAFLGKPSRFWRMFLRPGTSWISRGFIFVGGFIIVAGVQILVSLYAPGSGIETFLKALAALLAFCEAIYTGFAMNYVNGIPFWNSALVPVLFILYGILGGCALLIGIVLAGAPATDLSNIESLSRVLMLTGVLFLIIYLWSAAYTGETGKESVRELLKGHLAALFWVGLVALGIIVPLVLLALSVLGHEIPSTWLVTAIICEVIGGLSLRYCLLKGALYSPLIPSNRPG